MDEAFEKAFLIIFHKMMGFDEVLAVFLLSRKTAVGAQITF
jgi:hypothetical protein